MSIMSHCVQRWCIAMALEPCGHPWIAGKHQWSQSQRCLTLNAAWLTELLWTLRHLMSLFWPVTHMTLWCSSTTFCLSFKVTCPSPLELGIARCSFSIRHHMTPWSHSDVRSPLRFRNIHQIRRGQSRLVDGCISEQFVALVILSSFQVFEFKVCLFLFFDREASFDKALLAAGTLWTGFPAGPSRGAVTRCITALKFKARIKTNANLWTFGLWTGKVHKPIIQLRMIWIMILIDQVTERDIYKSSMKIDSKPQVQRLGHVVKPKLWPPSLVEKPGASQSFRENSFST